MNKNERFQWAVIVILVTMVIGLSAGVIESKEDVANHRIMLDHIYFEVYGTQFTEDYKPTEDDRFFPMFNSRIDENKNLGKTLFAELYNDKSDDYLSRIDSLEERVEITSAWTHDTTQFLNDRSYDRQLLENRVETLEKQDKDRIWILHWICVHEGQCE